MIQVLPELLCVGQALEVFFHSFQNYFSSYLCSTRKYVNIPQFSHSKTCVPFRNLNDRPFSIHRKDLRLSAFMNEWKQQLCRDYRSCKESSTGRPARTMVLPLKSLLAKIMLILFGGAVYILMLQLLSYNPQEVDLRWMIFESESWWSVPFISAVSHNRE